MKRRTILIMLLLFSVILAGCNTKRKDTSDGNTVKVYYIDTKTSSLASENYELKGTKTEDQIDELLYMLKNTPKNMAYKNALPDNVYDKYKLDKKNLSINFNDSYTELSEVEEVLCRAAVVKTICQLKGVEYIQFSVSEQPLKDADGVAVGTLTAEDFIDNTETSTSYKVKLYFADKSGKALVEYLTDINYSGKESIEEQVIKQLINGPTELGMYSTIPEGTTLLNVSKADKICTVDFNEKFLDKMPNVDEDVVIYSIVNTLVELPDINYVQFTVNGEVQKKYWEDVKLDAPLDSKLDLIENPE